MIQQIHPRDLAAWLQAAQAHGSQPLLLDVREPWEQQMARVAPQGMELLSIPMHTVPVRLHELDASRPIACLCHHGGRSMQVTAFLMHHGFGQVVNIAGGIDAWSRELDPSVPRY